MFGGEQFLKRVYRQSQVGTAKSGKLVSIFKNCWPPNMEQIMKLFKLTFCSDFIINIANE